MAVPCPSLSHTQKLICGCVIRERSDIPLHMQDPSNSREQTHVATSTSTSHSCTTNALHNLLHSPETTLCRINTLCHKQSVEQQSTKPELHRIHTV